MSSVHTTISGAISETASDETRLDGVGVVDSDKCEVDIRLSIALALGGVKSDMCEPRSGKSINDPFPNPGSCLTRDLGLDLIFQSSTRIGLEDERWIYMLVEADGR